VSNDYTNPNTNPKRPSRRVKRKLNVLVWDWNLQGPTLKT